jgi:hypothetical protein
MSKKLIGLLATFSRSEISERAFSYLLAMHVWDIREASPAQLAWAQHRAQIRVAGSIARMGGWYQD